MMSRSSLTTRRGKGDWLHSDGRSSDKGMGDAVENGVTGRVSSFPISPSLHDRGDQSPVSGRDRTLLSDW
jgi:hypothetical protein